MSEVAAELDHTIGLLSAELVMVARDCFIEARDLLALASQGTSRSEAHQALALLGQALAQLNDVASATINAKETVSAYRAHIAAPEGGPGDAPLPPTKASEPRPEPRSARDTDRQAADLMDKLPARSGEPGQKTSGYWISDDGTERGPLTSGQNEDYEYTKAVLRNLGIGPAKGELFVASHVETKFAARVRDSKHERLTLVINNRPCDDGRYSCDRLLPKILRPGQEVTVYWPGGKGTYRGGKS